MDASSAGRKMARKGKSSWTRAATTISRRLATQGAPSQSPGATPGAVGISAARRACLACMRIRLHEDQADAGLVREEPGARGAVGERDAGLIRLGVGRVREHQPEAARPRDLRVAQI